jgi:transcription elongation factor Elf1
MTCPNCRGARLVQIGLKLKERRVTMHSCSRCDTRWWDAEGERLGLPNVLEMATVRR